MSQPCLRSTIIMLLRSVKSTIVNYATAECEDCDQLRIKVNNRTDKSKTIIRLFKKASQNNKYINSDNNSHVNTIH